MGCADVPDLVSCYATEEKKFQLLFPPTPLLPLPLCLQLPLVCIEVQAIAGVSFHEPRFRRFGF